MGKSAHSHRTRARSFSSAPLLFPLTYQECMNEGEDTHDAPPRVSLSRKGHSLCRPKNLENAKLCEVEIVRNITICARICIVHIIDTSIQQLGLSHDPTAFKFDSNIVRTVSLINQGSHPFPRRMLHRTTTHGHDELPD